MWARMVAMGGVLGSVGERASAHKRGVLGSASRGADRAERRGKLMDRPAGPLG